MRSNTIAALLVTALAAPVWGALAPVAPLAPPPPLIAAPAAAGLPALVRVSPYSGSGPVVAARPDALRVVQDEPQAPGGPGRLAPLSVAALPTAQAAGLPAVAQSAVQHRLEAVSWFAGFIDYEPAPGSYMYWLRGRVLSALAAGDTEQAFKLFDEWQRRARHR